MQFSSCVNALLPQTVRRENNVQLKLCATAEAANVTSCCFLECECVSNILQLI
jgi:hypothetical protein